MNKNILNRIFTNCWKNKISSWLQKNGLRGKLYCYRDYHWNNLKCFVFLFEHKQRKYSKKQSLAEGLLISRMVLPLIESSLTSSSIFYYVVFDSIPNKATSPQLHFFHQIFITGHTEYFGLGDSNLMTFNHPKTQACSLSEIFF